MTAKLKIKDKLTLKSIRLARRFIKIRSPNSSIENQIKRKKQKRVISVFGKIEYDNSYNHKTQRSKN